jgi:hypothetical protein
MFGVPDFYWELTVREEYWSSDVMCYLRLSDACDILIRGVRLIFRSLGCKHCGILWPHCQSPLWEKNPLRLGPGSLTNDLEENNRNKCDLLSLRVIVEDGHVVTFSLSFFLFLPSSLFLFLFLAPSWCSSIEGPWDVQRGSEDLSFLSRPWWDHNSYSPLFLFFLFGTHLESVITRYRSGNCESVVLNHFAIKAFCTLDPVIVPQSAKCFNSKMVKHCALTNVNSDRGFESRPG